MASVNLYLDKRRQKEDGTYPVKVNVRHVGKFLVNTGLSARAEAWDEKVGYNRKDPNYKAKNIRLRSILNGIESYIIEMDNNKVKKTDKELKNEIECAILGKKVKSDTLFLDYLERFMSTKSRGTQSVYGTTRNKIIAFDSSCTFDTIDRKWLQRFEQSMVDSGMKINAYAIHLRNIRAVFNWAIDEELTSNYPFRKFKIQSETTRKRALTVVQLATLRDYPCEEYQMRYRDMFMLMFYLIGINAADLFMAKPEQVVNGRLEYKRAKTGKLYSVLIQPEANAIIEKYRGKNYLLNIMDEYLDYRNFLHRMGIALKEIGEVTRVGLGGKKVRNPLFPDISSYWSRHTWATIAAELDVPKEVIAHALGHSWALNTTTDIYIRFDEKKVDEANRRVIDYVNETNKAAD